MVKYKTRQDANYDKFSQKQPTVRMGEGNFANLPDKAMIKSFADFPDEATYRDGLPNKYADGVGNTSGIFENITGK